MEEILINPMVSRVFVIPLGIFAYFIVRKAHNKWTWSIFVGLIISIIGFLLTIFHGTILIGSEFASESSSDIPPFLFVSELFFHLGLLVSAIGYCGLELVDQSP